MIFKIYNSNRDISSMEKTRIVSFLNTHLDDYGDSPEDIGKAVDFALQISNPFLKILPLGGMVLIGKEDRKIVGAVVMNRTGMNGYVPDNLLVYIAVHKDFRGQGFGKQLIRKTIELTQGDIKLHVEHDNPAKFLYEKIGFTAPYLEMRFKNSK
ncbi:MAG: GNAT family N-acetyltransferase [Bacteroidota bacterium]|nr:GNAT family N-acetyltransferase [Bacteroidota bacterium]